jgi:hypothetical protein
MNQLQGSYETVLAWPPSDERALRRSERQRSMSGR